MKIGFDGKRAVSNNTGLGNYSRLLVEVLARKYADHQYTLYTPRMSDNDRLAPLEALPNVDFATPDRALWRPLGALWRSKGMTAQLRRDHVDLYHGLSGELPLDIARSGIPSVVTIHDVIFRRFPECYKPVDRKIYNYKFRRAVEDASRVIAISECTKRDIVADYGIDPAKVDVVYQGCAEQFHRIPSPDEIASVKARYHLTRPYVIAVGTVERRKNQLQAVEGMAMVEPGVDLVIVGRRTDYGRDLDSAIARLGLADRVKFIDRVAFADLPALYAGAVCSTYTSRYEGFGIPVIESLSTGTPAVIATGSCLEEAGGPSAPIVSPDDTGAWAGTVNRLILDDGFRKATAEAGHAYVERFSDDAMASGVMDTYLKVLNR